MKKSWSLPTKASRLLASSAFIAMLGVSGCVTMPSPTPGGDDPNCSIFAHQYTLAQRSTDRNIENTAVRKINAWDPTLYKRSRININSYFSDVVMSGEVPDAVTKENIFHIVSTIPEVVRIRDGLNISYIHGASDTRHDQNITAQINDGIARTNVIRESQVQVVTDDGIVYVVGMLTPVQRNHLISIVDGVSYVQKLVLFTDLVDDRGVLLNQGQTYGAASSADYNAPYVPSGSRQYEIVMPQTPVYTNPSYEAAKARAQNAIAGASEQYANSPYSTNNPYGYQYNNQTPCW